MTDDEEEAEAQGLDDYWNLDNYFILESCSVLSIYINFL
jgi:hypothetical protein